MMGAWCPLAVRGKRFVYNTALLTLTSVVMHFVGLAFQVYLSKEMGASGLGLLYLALSVSGFAATVAISGSRFAATRIVSEEMGLRHPGGVKKTVRRCVGYAGAFGVLAAVLLFSFAPFIGGKLIGDPRTVPALRILSLGMPPLSMGAVLSGYFTASGRIAKGAAGQLCEQLVKILAVVLVFSQPHAPNPQWECCVIMAGSAAGELVSFLLEWALYCHDRKKYLAGEKSGDHLTGRIVKVAMPLALSAYARTALNSVLNLEIPRSLRRFGAGAEEALADYGRMQGMVFPIVTFPSALFASMAELLVPELTVSQVQGDGGRIANLMSTLFRLCLLFSVFAAVCFFLFGQELALAFYEDREAGRYVTAMAFLMPVMYLDTLTDGMLRGLGEQLYCMAVNVADSVLCVALVVLLVPRWGIGGYLFVLYSSEILNFSFSFGRLRRLTRFPIPAGELLLGVLCAVGAGNFALLFVRQTLPAFGSGTRVGAELLLSSALYVPLLLLTGVLKKNDFRILKKLQKP